jgi:hypothetical protein
MSRRVKPRLAIGLWASVSAYAAPVPEQKEIVFIDPAPIVREPLHPKCK